VRRTVLVGVVALVAAAAGGYAVGQDARTPAGASGAESSEVPASCLDALDYADEGFGIAGSAVELMAEGFAVSGDAIMAVSNYDIAGIQAATADMKRITAEIEVQNDEIDAISLPYRQARDDCRAAG
jgi:hypothetical protein